VAIAKKVGWRYFSTIIWNEGNISRRTFPGENPKRVGHPVPFPLELPKRCIKLFSYVNDTVLDPFLGSGTTRVAASLLNRKCIGVEINKDYCETAKRRLIEEGKILK